MAAAALFHPSFYTPRPRYYLVDAIVSSQRANNKRIDGQGTFFFTFFSPSSFEIIINNEKEKKKRRNEVRGVSIIYFQLWSKEIYSGKLTCKFFRLCRSQSQQQQQRNQALFLYFYFSFLFFFFSLTDQRRVTARTSISDKDVVISLPLFSSLLSHRPYTVHTQLLGPHSTHSATLRCYIKHIYIYVYVQYTVYIYKYRGKEIDGERKKERFIIISSLLAVLWW